MKKIDGQAKTVRELLSDVKYSVDYYQREYKWEEKHIRELIEDLTGSFLENYEPSHPREAVEHYGHYFLGSIILSRKDNLSFIVDGQQRLTTLTLLLIYLNNLQREKEKKVDIGKLIYSEKYDKKSFNLHVDEREPCMDALFEQKPFDNIDLPESVQNILARYSDIEELFPNELHEQALPYFIDWLIDNVHLVEINAYKDQDAYTIFEAMNDRGLSLSPTDMLKGYLLANITDTAKRNEASKIWRDRVAALQTLGKEEETDGIKSWLRSQHATSIRERKGGAVPKDFDLIGTEFHRWVRDNEENLGLKTIPDFWRFIQQDFSFYSRLYHSLRKASETLMPGLEGVYFNAQNNFTLQYPVLLAPLGLKESESECLRKIRITSAYLDILLARRIWNWRAIDYSTMQYAMFLVLREIRGKSAMDLVAILSKRLDEDSETFAANDRFHLHGNNGRQIHRMLARMTDYVETSSGMASHYMEYIQRRGKNGYEVEHIWANHPERHEDEFSHPTDFQEYRNRIGGLLLLPKSFNASFGDLPYAEKREHYNSQNLLARTLHEKAYDHNPGFKRFLQESALPFKAHPEFSKDDLDTRQKLYGKVAEEIWNPDRLKRELIE